MVIHTYVNTNRRLEIKGTFLYNTKLTTSIMNEEYEEEETR